MIKMVMHGCNGAMGQVITKLVKDDPEISIVAGVDISNHINNTYPVFNSLEECNIDADVVIDFASAAAVDSLLESCEKKALPLVLCTTGLSKDQLDKAQKISEHIAVLRSANMSLGVNALIKLVADAAGILAPSGFDTEIVEKHHNKKLDAPSGTAIALADSVNHALDNKYHYIYDRSSEHRKRSNDEIGIVSVRGGSIVGEHDVIFAGTDEVITLSHTAYSKAIFAKGAIQAGKFLAGKPAGFYTMSDVIG